MAKRELTPVQVLQRLQHKPEKRMEVIPAKLEGFHALPVIRLSRTGCAGAPFMTMTALSLG
jgi:hypothetical protein